MSFIKQESREIRKTILRETLNKSPRTSCFVSKS